MTEERIVSDMEPDLNTWRIAYAQAPYPSNPEELVITVNEIAGWGVDKDGVAAPIKLPHGSVKPGHRVLYPAHSVPRFEVVLQPGRRVPTRMEFFAHLLSLSRPEIDPYQWCEKTYPLEP